MEWTWQKTMTFTALRAFHLYAEYLAGQMEFRIQKKEASLKRRKKYLENFRTDLVRFEELLQDIFSKAVTDASTSTVVDEYYKAREVLKKKDPFLDLRVGPHKPMGYVVLDSLSSLEGWRPASGVETFQKERPEGGFFVYACHVDSLNSLLEKHTDVLRASGWPQEAFDFMVHVAHDKVSQTKDPELYRLIGLAFNDPRFRKDA